MVQPIDFVPVSAGPPPSVPSRFEASAPYLLFLLVTLVVFGPALARGDYPCRPDLLPRMWPWRHVLKEAPPPEAPVGMSDPVVYFHPANRFHAVAVRHGNIPFWNPHVFCGYPALATGQNGFFYPPKWLLFRFLDLPRAMTLHLALHLWGAGAAMAFLLRTRGIRPFGACLGGLTWMLAETNAFFLGFDVLTVASVWLSLMAACAGLAFRHRSIAWACAGGLAFGCGLLGGYLQRVYYAALIIGIWAAVEGLRGAWRARGEPVGRCLRLALVPPCLAALLVALGTAAGAVTVVPFLEILRDPLRHAMPYASLFSFSWLRLATLATLGAPRLLGGDLDRLEFWSQAGTSFREFTPYVGVLAFALALGAGFGSRRREGVFFSAAAAAALLIILGTPLARAAYALLPGFDRSDPTRLFWVWDFGLAGLAGMGADALAAAPGATAWRRIERGLWLVTGLAAAGAAVCTLVTWAGVRLSPAQWGSLLNPAIATGILGLAAAAAVVTAARRRRQPRALPALACGVVALDLLHLLIPMNPTANPATLYPETPAIRELRAAARGGEPFRTVGRRALPWWEWHATNALSAYDLDTPEGYDPIRPGRYSHFVRHVTGSHSSEADFARTVAFREIEGQERLFSFLNVRFVMADPGEVLPLPGWRAVALPDATLYENPAPQPRAFLVSREEVIPDRAAALARLAAPAFSFRESVVLHEPPPEADIRPVAPLLTTGTVAFSRPSAGEVVLDVTTDGRGFVVLSEAHVPGWEARLNGASCSLLRANYAFRAVVIPAAGTWRVDMTYRPGWWPWAGYASLAGGLVGLIGLGMAVFQAGSRAK